MKGRGPINEDAVRSVQRSEHEHCVDFVSRDLLTGDPSGFDW
jgi:hypothetical protein